jgi:ubiquinone/menaquinone biosynthesis C-methylase UbiE
VSGRATFSRVDGADDPGALVAYLDEAKRQPLFREVGRLLMAELRLAPGAHAVDVGCGTGADALAMAAAVAPGGRVTGIDASATMIAEARRRSAGRDAVAFRVGRAERLDLPGGDADACRFERVLQHLPDPAVALREAARVLRPGGQVGVLEPDWHSVEIAGADPGVTRRVLDLHLRSLASPGAGARLAALLAEAGFVEVRSVEVRCGGSHTGALASFRVEAWARAAEEAGAVTPAESAAWLRDLAAAVATGTLGIRASLHLSAGTRPAT